MDLTVHHLDCQYRIPPKQPPRATRARLDGVASRLLAASLAEQSEPLLDDDGAFYFVEQLHASLTLTPGLSDYHLARSWAAGLSQSIAQRLRRSEGVIVFRRRSAFLAAFLVDLAAGAADDIWYYRQFLHPGGLTPGARAALLLLQDPDCGRDALLEVHARGRLENLLQLLAPEELKAIVTGCLLPPSPEVVHPENFRRWCKALLELLASQRFLPSSSQPRDTLILYTELLHAHPDLGPDVNLARFLWRIVEFAAACRTLPQLPSLIRSGDWAQIRPLLESTGQARFLGSLLLAVPGREITAIAEHLHPPPAQSIQQRFFTDFAGVFLLASSVLELDSPRANSAKASSTNQPETTPLALYLVLLQCLGALNLPLSTKDRGVVLFSGLAALPSAQELGALASSLDPESTAGATDPWFSLSAPGSPLETHTALDARLQLHSKELLRLFLRRLGAFADSSPEFTYRNLLCSRGAVTVSAESISVRFLTCPLRMVLRMAGFASSPIALPWAGNRMLEIDLD